MLNYKIIQEQQNPNMNIGWLDRFFLQIDFLEEQMNYIKEINEKQNVKNSSLIIEKYKNINNIFIYDYLQINQNKINEKPHDEKKVLMFAYLLKEKDFLNKIKDLINNINLNNLKSDMKNLINQILNLVYRCYLILLDSYEYKLFKLKVYERKIEKENLHVFDFINNWINPQKENMDFYYLKNMTIIQKMKDKQSIFLKDVNDIVEYMKDIDNFTIVTD